MSIINECYNKSIELLLKNSSSYGFLASSVQKKAVERNYLNIFARDSSVCVLGAVASKNKKLLVSAKKSLEILSKFQAKNGQIPNYVRPKSNYANYWKMGCIDASLWWLIAIKFYDYNTKGEKLEKKLNIKINKTINWLYAQEHPLSKLVIQNEASDWADIFPRSGNVLYTNALWVKVKDLYNLEDQKKSKNNFNSIFYPYNSKINISLESCRSTIQEILKTTKETDYFISYINYLYWGKDLDVYGNALALIFGSPSDKIRKKIIKYILTQKRLKKMPIPILFHPIMNKSRAWRKYMESHNQNYPYQYHNGGIWPYASSFWVVVLFSGGWREEAKNELEKIAYANSLNNWEFNEWFHGKNGKAQGMKHQSWNAGAYLFAWYYLKGDILL